MQKEIELIKKEYQRQKVLEKIVNSRVLVRPGIKKWQVAASFVALPFLILLLILFLVLSKLRVLFKVIIAILSIIIMIELYLRFVCIIVVKRYQTIAKEETRRRCKCIPSCSEYAIMCLQKIFPIFYALLKIRKRLYKTCNGEEYKIDFPTKKMGEKFENTLQ